MEGREPRTAQVVIPLIERLPGIMSGKLNVGGRRNGLRPPAAIDLIPIANRAAGLPEFMAWISSHSVIGDRLF